jgi:lysophospholipase L1-like esterase
LNTIPVSLLRFGLAIVLLWTALAYAQERAASPAAPARWAQAMRDFAAMDRLKPPRPGSVVFVGSSSVRLWNGLEGQFGSTVVLKRGFGGARLSDCIEHLEQLVVKYRPRLVLLYAGDNDLAEGTPPREVLRRFVAFAERVQRRVPGARLAFVSIKPSPAREQLLPQVLVTNRLIEAYVRGRPQLAYVDVFNPMLNADGLPRQELFAADGLHLNADGYALWRSILVPLLRRDPRDQADAKERSGQHAQLGPNGQRADFVAEHAEGY